MGKVDTKNDIELYSEIINKYIKEIEGFYFRRLMCFVNSGNVKLDDCHLRKYLVKIDSIAFRSAAVTIFGSDDAEQIIEGYYNNIFEQFRNHTEITTEEAQFAVKLNRGMFRKEFKNYGIKEYKEKIHNLIVEIKHSSNTNALNKYNQLIKEFNKMFQV